MFHWCEWQLRGLIEDYRAWNILKVWESGKEDSHGFHFMDKEKHMETSSKAGKSSSKQRWRCTVTGHVSNAGGLMVWQRARGIDTRLKERIA